MTTKKILLVDDTKLFLELEKNFLKRSPVRVLTASNGDEALEIISNERPDLVFMDIHMPGMDGAACCRKIKADQALRDTPIVMVSSSAKEEDVEQCRQAGCDDYITKPIDRRIFLEKARSFLDLIDRREARIPCKAHISFTVDGISHTGTSADLSCGGIYVATDGEINEKRELNLEISLPESMESPISAKGIVAWENGAGKRRKPTLPAGFGVEFVEMPESDSRQLQLFVTSSRSAE